MVIVDTSVWIEFFGGRVTPETVWLKNAIRNHADLGLTSLILCEVLQGIMYDRQFRMTRDYLFALPIFEAARMDLAVEAAENYRTLRARAFTVRSMIDCMTATFCIREGHTLLHRDRDFGPFADQLGLATVRP